MQYLLELGRDETSVWKTKESWVIQPLDFGYQPLFSQPFFSPFPIISKIFSKVSKEKRKLRAAERTLPALLLDTENVERMT